MIASDTRGFTLLELIVVLAIAGLLFSLGGPSVRTLAATMEYRDAVRQIVSAAKNARRDAFAQGIPMDLLIDTDRNRYALSADSPSVSADQFAPLPEALDITVVYAAEVSPKPGLAAIRFTRQGGPLAARFRWPDPAERGPLTIDWLLGDVTQEAF